MRFSFAVMMALVAVVAVPACAADRDGDGISDEHEQILGTNPDLPETLVVVNQDGVEPEEGRGEGYDPTKDVVQVEFCHVAEDRYLWRTTFAAPPRLEDTVHHIYIDADCNDETGRTNGTGTDYMLSVVEGSATSGYYTPTGERTSGPTVNFVTEGNTLLVSADCELGRDENGVRFEMWILCHTATSEPPMSDSTGTFLVQNIPLLDREKIMRPSDYTESVKVVGTFGLDIIRPLLRDERNIVINYDKLETDGFAVDLFTSRRYGHVSMERRGGRVWTTVPRAGTYYVGFMMYDDGSDQRIAIYVNDEFAGLAVANAGNNRTWIYHLSEPRELKAGDVITLEGLGTSGKHGICNILLMPEAPPRREIEYRVENTNWVAPVGTDGEVIISWTTTWPSASRFEYGPTTDYGQVATEDCHRLVHRVRLSGLEPGTTYHGRGVGIAPDGSEYYGPDVTFTPDGIDPPPTREGVTQVPLTVRNWHDVDAVSWPVTNGVPFPQGVLGSENDLRITRDGQEVPAQVKPLGTWPDGSLKWVLVSILADVPAGEAAQYILEFGRNVTRQLKAEPMARVEGDTIVIDTGAVQFSVQGLDITGPTGTCHTQLTDSAGVQYSSAGTPAQVTLEENGPVRVVVKSVGNLIAEDGSESFRIEQRVVAYRGQPFVRVYHTFINDREERYTNIESMSLLVPATVNGWQVEQAEGEEVTLAVGDSIWQRFDDEYVINGEEPRQGRLTGSVISADGSMAVAVRDCWQNYPKGFAVTDEGLRVDLCPDFEAGLYDQFPFEEEGHHLYYYLLDGHYRFKQGMAKTHELLLDFGGDVAAHARIFQRPLLLTAEPEWYCGSKAFYNVAPRNEELFAAYEAAIDRNIQNYITARAQQHDFGLMNYGDWYGERGANWGNIEYDTQHAFFLEYIRSGNPDAFFLGDAAETHNRDIDTVNWAPDPHNIGLVWIHQMGHVGGYYDKSVPGTLGFPSAGSSVTHAWAEGHFDHYYLTGDPRSLEIGMAVVDYFTDKELSRPYDWLSAREPGWHLIMLAAALAATNDPYYLNAARIVVDRVLETQDVEPRELPDYQKEPGREYQVGGWSRMMVPGHCRCVPRHRGNANFMIAILLTGLTYYHDVTQEPAVKECIIRGAHYMMDEFYSTETHGFRYTSCPNMRYGTGASPLMVEGIARAYRWTRDERFLDPLTHGLALGARGSSYGKSFSMYYRCAPRLLADLAAVGLTLEEAEQQALVPFTMPDWLKELPEERKIVIQAEDFAAQGGGKVEVATDRHATWGSIVTKWHADIGHWLEWKFSVPADGRYRIVFRYGTNCEATRRRLEIDGVVPHEAAAEIAFPNTGGFGHNPGDWRYLTLQDAGGEDVLLPLSAGEHTLRMTNLNEGMGLDFIVLVRED